MCHHDQSWMFLETSPKYQYVPDSLLSSSGHMNTQDGRAGFTHCATAVQNALTGEMMEGPGAIIIPSQTNDGGKSLSKARKKQIKEQGYSLKFGLNKDVGRFGLALWVSDNAWQKQYHLDENVDLLHANGKLENMIVYTDNWSILKNLILVNNYQKNDIKLSKILYFFILSIFFEAFVFNFFFLV